MEGSVLKQLFLMTAYFISRSRGQFQPCSSDDECNVRTSCVNGGCIDPCTVMDCGPNTRCIALNHRAECTCLQGYVVSQTQPGCTREMVGQCVHQSDCGPSQRCVRNECMELCPGACGIMLNCSVVDHVPYCYASSITPQPVVPVPACSSDHDCDPDRRCEGTCINPCDRITCRNNGSVCYANNHRALCVAVRPPFGKSHYDEKQFYISEKQTTWSRAFNECWMLGMQFATVSSDKEWEKLKKMLHDTGRNSGAWLAARRLQLENGVYWVQSGSNVDYKVPWSSELNKKKKDSQTCVATGAMNSDWKWNTFECNDLRYYACEYYNF